MKIDSIGLKKKVSLGFVVLGLILFFSSLIAVFEFSRMSNHVTDLISDNIKSINTARELLTISEDYNFKLMAGVGSEAVLDISLINDDNFISYFKDLKKTFTTDEEKLYADSVIFAYTAYMQVARETETIWLRNYSNRREWFFGSLQPVYKKLRNYIQKLTYVSQDALAENSQSLQESFYRSIMPCIAAVCVGIVIVLLFNYFLNHYLINPILRISNGIQKYKQFNKSYDVKVEKGDEISDLNDSVKELIEDNQSYKKRL